MVNELKIEELFGICIPISNVYVNVWEYRIILTSLNDQNCTINLTMAEDLIGKLTS